MSFFQRFEDGESDDAGGDRYAETPAHLQPDIKIRDRHQPADHHSRDDRSQRELRHLVALVDIFEPIEIGAIGFLQGRAGRFFAEEETSSADTLISSRGMVTIGALHVFGTRRVPSADERISQQHQNGTRRVPNTSRSSSKPCQRASRHTRGHPRRARKPTARRDTFPSATGNWCDSAASAGSRPCSRSSRRDGRA